MYKVEVGLSNIHLSSAAPKRKSLTANSEVPAGTCRGLIQSSRQGKDYVHSEREGQSMTVDTYRGIVGEKRTRSNRNMRRSSSREAVTSTWKATAHARIGT